MFLDVFADSFHLCMLWVFERDSEVILGIGYTVMRNYRYNFLLFFLWTFRNCILYIQCWKFSYPGNLKEIHLSAECGLDGPTLTWGFIRCVTEYRRLKIRSISDSLQSNPRLYNYGSWKSCYAQSQTCWTKYSYLYCIIWRNLSCYCLRN